MIKNISKSQIFNRFVYGDFKCRKYFSLISRYHEKVNFFSLFSLINFPLYFAFESRDGFIPGGGLTVHHGTVAVMFTLLIFMLISRKLSSLLIANTVRHLSFDYYKYQKNKDFNNSSSFFLHHSNSKPMLP